MPAVGSLPRGTRLPLRAAAVRAGLREFQLAHPSSWGKWKNRTWKGLLRCCRRL